MISSDSLSNSTHSSTDRPIFALLIGIDEYKRGTKPSPRRLRGCVSDSNNIYDFLTRSFNVPPKDIKVLQNEQATRTAILSFFEKHLINNSAIQENDAIIFYFAGHGSRRTAPQHWHLEEGKVETICPYDTVDANDIPDYTVGHLMRKLANYKGRNIVGASFTSLSKLTLVCIRLLFSIHATRVGWNERKRKPKA